MRFVQHTKKKVNSICNTKNINFKVTGDELDSISVDKILTFRFKMPVALYKLINFNAFPTEIKFSPNLYI